MNPIVKWAGGKRQLIRAIIQEVPSNFNTYFEPFFGGGALLFNLMPNNAHVNDINNDLMSLYKIFKSNSDLKLLIRQLKIHERKHSKEYYYQIRELDRKNSFKSLSHIKKAARLLYLNKTCFNGLYRVNSEGFFNVPFNGKDKVTLYNKANFDELHRYFSSNKINISIGDFSSVLASAKRGDFVYFDPPYDNVSDKNSFTAYSKENFNQKDQVRLFDVCTELDKRGVKWLFSNHNTPLIKDLFKNYKIIIIKANRNINSDSSKRRNFEELLIKNY